MSFITFDILYNNKSEAQAFKLSGDSEFQQLKLMICGKYKIYDLTKLKIIYKGAALNCEMERKIKTIFKSSKVKLTISTNQQETATKPKNPPELSKKDSKPVEEPNNIDNIDCFCKCKSKALYVCDQCNELMCDKCYQKSKHLNHVNKVMPVKEYPEYIKELLKLTASELDEKITKDESFHFLSCLKSDLENETKAINESYDYMKNVLEDIREIEHDFLSTLTNVDKFKEVKNEIETVMKHYGNINLSDSCESIINQKKKILKESQEILMKYSMVKAIIITYTNIQKDFQIFNSSLINEIKKKFDFVKRNFMANSDIEKRVNSNPLYKNNIYYSNFTNEDYFKINKKYNFYSNSSMNDSYYFGSPLNRSQPDLRKTKPKLNYFSPINIHTKSFIDLSSYPGCNSTENCNANKTMLNPTLKDNFIYKLKNKNKIFSFSTTNQTFREKEFFDNCYFKNNMGNESGSDVIQLNLKNKLYLLSGKKHNRFYYYEPRENTINFLMNSLYSHYLGCLIYCEKNNSIYLLGGNGQLKCEMFPLQKNKFQAIGELAEERQEFAAMYFKDYIYVFFGFSASKGVNLSSIERLDVETNSKFEIIYVNDQISLCSLGCAQYFEENSDEDNDEILLLGGFNGNNYVDTSLVFNAKDLKIRDCDVLIPNVNKQSQFLFQKECNFIMIDNSSQIAFDSKNNVHLISIESYELFSEANEKK